MYVELYAMKGKLLANIISALIPSRKLRHRIRRWKGFETKQDKLMKELNYIKDLIRCMNPPSMAAQAVGIRRGVQLMMAGLLNKITALSKENNIDMWLDFGTLIGAVRHKGFVPWDDDVDVAIRAEDASRLKQLLRENGYDVIDKGTAEAHFRVALMALKGYDLHIDVYLYHKIELPDFQAMEKLNAYMVKEGKKHPFAGKEYQQQVKDFISQLQNNNTDNLTTWVRGIGDVFSYTKVMAVHEAQLFPLTELEFEGVAHKVPAQYMEYLTDIYGDFMSWPSSLDNNNIANRMSSQLKLKAISQLQNN